MKRSVTTSETPSVTLIVPTRDRAGLVERTIESLLAQDYGALELIVLDDGSTDDTQRLLERYARSADGRFRWSRHQHMGQAQTLNRGFEMAEGELVGYVSSDDLLLPGAVTRLVEEIRDYPQAVLVYPTYRVIDEAGEVIGAMNPPEYSRAESVRLQDTIVGPGAIFRRGAVEQAGGWNPDYLYLGDFDFWLRLSGVGGFRRIPEPLACWRRHDGALTVANRGPDMAFERIRLLDELYAGDVPADLEEVRGEAYRNAFILAALVVAPGANSAGERYYVADSHARTVSSEAGPANPEAKIADLRRRLAEQERVIGDLTATANALRQELESGHPLLGLASRLAPTRLQLLARRLLHRGARPSA
jgi:uncharacterized coiled-coil protein SlyX